MINTRYSNDMLLRHKKKINLQQSIEMKTNSLDILKVSLVIRLKNYYYYFGI